MKIRVRESGYSGEKEVSTYRTEMPDDVAACAVLFLERWSLVAAMPDGEDSAGRAKLRLPTADEIVTRAFDIAEKYYATARARGHLLDLPDLNAINAEYDAEKAETVAKEAERRTAKRAQAAV
jgi:hypothetical protein